MDTQTTKSDVVNGWNAPSSISDALLYKVELNKKGLIVSADKVSASLKNATVEDADSRKAITADGKRYALSSSLACYQITEDEEYKLFNGTIKAGDTVSLYEIDSSNDGYDVLIYTRP